QLTNDRLLPIPCRSLACQCKVGRAVFVTVCPVSSLLAPNRFQQRHEQPSLLLSQLVSGNGLERLHGRAHAALAFWLVVGSGSVFHVACCCLQNVVCLHALTAPSLIRISSVRTMPSRCQRRR